MNDKEVLEACITKAIKGGWIPDRYDECERSQRLDYEFVYDWYNFRSYPENYRLFIFNHDFAKALWGETQVTDRLWQKLDEPTDNGREYLLNVKPAWQYHLQQLAIAENRIAYLRENA